MEFPELGKQCAVDKCKQLDFLPMECQLCSKVLCKDHIGYEQHNCTELFKKDRRVPVCPLCNKPISVSPGEVPDRRVNEHIENDCKSDLAFAKRKTYSNRCSVKGCKKRELVPVTCAMCRKNFCLRHRHESDHDCLHATTALPTPSKGAVEKRTQSSKQVARHQQRNVYDSHQGGMTEDEALAFALQASLAEELGNSNENQSSTSQSTTAYSKEDEDTRQNPASQNRSNKDSGCRIA